MAPGVDVHTGVVRRPGNQVAEVTVNPSGGPPADLAAARRRVAASLRFDRPEPVRPAYRLTFVPKGLVAGHRPAGRDRGDPVGAGPGGRAAAGGVGGRGRGPPPGRPPDPARADGRRAPVQGRPTHLVRQGGDQVALYVDRLVGRNSLTLNVTGGLVPEAELYRIADGVRLVDR